jgi:hypothetical protein
MKKVLLILLAIILIVVGVVIYSLNSANDFIRVQIEKHGSQFLGTEVDVDNVELAFSEGKISITGTRIKNPSGFSNENAFSLDEISLDIGNISAEPYTIQNILVDTPDVLYEVDASGKGNLLALKDNLSANLPEQGETTTSETGATPGPKIIVENVTVSQVKLRVNFEALNTGDLKLERKAYDVVLPTFNAGPIGQPNGLPAEQVGGAIAQAMLDNIIARAKEEAKKAAKEAAKERLNEEADKLKDKAKEKLKGLFN